ncbi:RHS repeat domain-containing protein [Reinekea sp.]|uniref:RHS repeat domain-containing protein n=2 Tax=Reinekea sp. TaxID=1970455 RepID=UPI00398A280C
MIDYNYLDGKLNQVTTPEGIQTFSYLCNEKLATVTEGTESLTYGYDGDLLTSLTYNGVLDTTINYRHNNKFQVDQVTYAGQTNAISYDDDGLATQIGQFTITNHAEHGLPTKVEDTALSQTLAYNGYGERTTSQTQFGSAALFDYSLTYDISGTITGKTESLPDGSTQTFVYGYDSRKRLTSVTKNGTVVEQYSYDANGNRSLYSSTERGLSNIASTYNIGDQLSSRGNTQYAYDANGRLSKKTEGTDVTHYQYSSTGRLLAVELPNGDTITYQHNALGNRVVKLVNDVVEEKYLWQNKTTLLATYDANDNLLQRYEYSLGQTPTAFTQGTNRFYIITDQIGTPRVITDATGTVVKQIEYDAYGNVINDTNPAMDIPFGFAGGLKDNHTGLIRFGYRDFDPEIGRWTARDPIGFAGGDTNLYGYVGGSPIQFVDSTGMARYHYNKNNGYLYYYEDGVPLDPLWAMSVYSGWHNPANKWAIPNGRYEVLPIENTSNSAMCDEYDNCWFVPFKPLSDMPMRDGLPRCTSVGDGGSGRCGFHPEDKPHKPGTNGCISFPNYDYSIWLKNFFASHPGVLIVSGSYE